MKWNKIDWEKAQDIYGLKDKEYWLTLAKNSGFGLDEDGCFPDEFTWEDGFQCGFPKKRGMYLGYFEITDDFSVVYYLTDADYPQFWNETFDYPSIPDYWTELPEKPIK